MSAEELAAQAADRVREVIADAERRAEEIVERAEAEAAEIRERAEADARARLERARRALSEIVGEAAPAEAPAADEAPAAEPAPEAGADPEPAPEPAPAPRAPEPAPTPALATGDRDSAARLVAMKLAIDGKGRDEIAAELDSKFGATDRSALLDDVLARAGR